MEGKWIKSKEKLDNCPIFKKEFSLEKKVLSASLHISALGVYSAEINHQRVGDFILSPGWTSYQHRIQYQTYEVSDLLCEHNCIEILVGKGWFNSRMPGWLETEDKAKRMSFDNAVICDLVIVYEDGSSEIIKSDNTWKVSNSCLIFNDIYDGEEWNLNYSYLWQDVEILEWSKEVLIQQQGEDIKEKERVFPKEIIETPKGELVIDFGQNLSGYICLLAKTIKNQKIIISHGEALDQEGNFYNKNYRSAKSEIIFHGTGKDELITSKLTYFGFRYIRISGEYKELYFDKVYAKVIYSDITRTGYIETGHEKINQLYENIIWGQKSNYIDVPTDCPQRDERLGWTGDAQVFTKVASYNFDVEKFYIKWLTDMKLEQREDGGIGQVIPDYLPREKPSAAWGDAVTICPWIIYLTYGNKEVLESQFDSMVKWIEYIKNTSTKAYLWLGGTHFGDWVGLDAKQGSYKGASREDFIASAFYYHSVSLVIKTGNALEKNVDKYIKLLELIKAAFNKEFLYCYTQTEYVLKLHFNLSQNITEDIQSLVSLIKNNGNAMTTGFVGTPYLLHVLVNFGYPSLAFDLLLREDYPSWLYSVNHGATTIWEHWDGVLEDGSFWDPEMNSFNHYAYGAIGDWLYEKVGGITVDENNPGFGKVTIKPYTDSRLKWFNTRLKTRHGNIQSKWIYQGEYIRYSFSFDMPAEVILGEQRYLLDKGKYTFWEKI